MAPGSCSLRQRSTHGILGYLLLDYDTYSIDALGMYAARYAHLAQGRGASCSRTWLVTRPTVTRQGLDSAQPLCVNLQRGRWSC